MFAEVSTPPPTRDPIRLIRASAGNTMRLIPVSEVICLEAADKYVTVVTAPGESQVRTPLRELATRLDGIELVQIHRSVMVNAARMVSATRDELGHYNLTLRGLDKTVKGAVRAAICFGRCMPTNPRRRARILRLVAV